MTSTEQDDGEVGTDAPRVSFESLGRAVQAKDLVKINEVLASIGPATLGLTNDAGRTILHFAVDTVDREIVRRILKCLRDVGLEETVKRARDSENLTPVHLAVQLNQPSIVTLLLESSVSTPIGRVSVSSLNNSLLEIPPDNTDLLQLALTVSPAMAGLVLSHCEGNPVTFFTDFEKMIEFDISSVRPSLESTVPLVVVGDSGAGKSSLIRTLQVEGKMPWLKYFILSVPGADTHTAGIIPRHFESIWFGKVVFFDLSSHREFVHEAILNCGSLVDAVFLIVVNLSDSIKKITQQIIYWIEFVRYYYSKVAGQTPPTIIIVGSHLANLKLGTLINRERFRIHSLPKAMENVDQAHFNIISKIEMDCRKTGPENAILRYEIKAQCERIRQARSPLPSKCYILYAIILDLVSRQAEGSVKAVTLTGLLGELRAQKIHCQLFEGTADEVLMLCNQLNKLNLLLVLKNKDSIDESWIVPDSYPFLCQIEGAIFPDQITADATDEYSVISNKNGVLTDSKIKEKFSKVYPEAHVDLLIMLMIHYKYCEEVSTTDSEKGYFFPHLLTPHLDIPPWEKEEGRFMFAWTLAPESRYHYFMPHLIHHFLLQLSQAEELGITNLERATRTLAWGDPSGVEVVVHIHSSQRLLVSMRSTPNHQLQCLKLRKPVLEKIKEILNALGPNTNTPIVESFIPVQKRVALPHINEDLIIKGKVRLYQAETIRSVIANREAVVHPLNHATPLITVNDILFFEPYYHMDCPLREFILRSPNDTITENHYREIGMSLGPAKLRLLDELLDNIEQPITEIPLESQIQQSYLRLMAKHGTLTCEQLRKLLDSVSFFELEDILTKQSSCAKEDDTLTD